MTLLAFLLALGVLITVHEWGHYRAAVACGVKVLTFSIGFGRPLLRWKSRTPHPGQDTEFVIGWIPLGGFVKMLDANEECLKPSDVHMAFDHQPLWKRAVIVSAGPVANLLLAVCLYAANFWMGQYETQATLSAPVVGSMAETAGLRSGDVVLRAGASPDEFQEIASWEALRWWVFQHETSPVFLEVQSQGKTSVRVLHLPELSEDVISQGANAWQARGFTPAWSRPVLADVQIDGAAHIAGLRRGDEVVHIDGHFISDAYALRSRVRGSGEHEIPKPQMWDVLREGQRFQVQVQPDQIQEGEVRFGRIGAQVGEAPTRVWIQMGLWDGLVRALERAWQVMAMTIDMVARLIVGHLPLEHLSGPLGMADYAGRSASLGLGPFLSYLALVSVSLGVFNLLPLPMLDGGHLLYYLYEACTGQPPSRQWLEVLQRVGLALLVALMVFSLFNDMVRLGWIS